MRRCDGDSCSVCALRGGFGLNGGWRVTSMRLGGPGSVGIIGTDGGICFPAEESTRSHGGKSFDGGAESIDDWCEGETPSDPRKTTNDRGEEEEPDEYVEDHPASQVGRIGPGIGGSRRRRRLLRNDRNSGRERDGEGEQEDASAYDGDDVGVQGHLSQI